jgi:hypothetical protein
MGINNFEDMWGNYTSGEKTMFQKCIRILLRRTFIVCEKDEESRKEYYFAARESETFSRYLSFIGYDIIVDRDNRVIMLQNSVSAGESNKMQINRNTLSLTDSIILCCLFTIYADRVKTGSLAQSIIIPVTDLRFQFEKYDVIDRVDKKGILTDSLNKLKKYNLIDVDGKVGEADTRIKIFPSIQFALSSTGFHDFAVRAEERMFTKDLKTADLELENNEGEGIEEQDDE